MYALFRAYNYKRGGIIKYSKNFFLNKFFKKKLLKKKKYYLKKKKLPFKFKKRPVIKKKKLNILEYFLPKKKVEITNFSDYRVETFKKIIKRKGRFIYRKYNLYRVRYLKNRCFLNYCFYVSNFKKNFGYAHKREVEHCLVSRTIEKLNYFFRNISVKKKKIYKNAIFNNYFFRKPRDYFMKKSYFNSTEEKDFTLTKDSFLEYDRKKFFIFNILKLFPKIFLNLSNKYFMPGSDYLFVKNKFKFRLGFYSNFLHIYRKFPILLFVKNFLSSFVNKFFNQVKFAFIFCSERFISSNLVRDFILSKISHKLKIGRITFAVIRFLNRFLKKKIIRGFRILLAGRFTRKDRATFY